MSPTHWTTALYLLLLAGLGVAQPSWWTHAAAVATGAYLLVSTWGVVSLRSQFFGPAFCRATPPGAQVALTFDDGPDPDVTPHVLDLLARRGVAAAFFVVAERAARHPELIRRAHAEGHLIGNHSHRHRPWTNALGPRAMHRELQTAQATLTELVGTAPRYYRPPVGLSNPHLAGVTRRLGLSVIGWTVRGLDTARRPLARVLARYRRGLAPGAIVLIHDGERPRARVLEITDAVLDEVAARGWTPVRLDRLPGAP